MSSPVPQRSILFVEGSHGFGGSTVGLARLVEGLDRRRFRAIVVVAHVTQRDYLVRMGVAGPGTGVDLHLVPAPRPKRGVLSRARLAGATVRYVRRLRGLCRGRDVELVHANNSVSINMGVILAARSIGAACVVKQRGFEWDSRVNRRLIGMVDAFLPDSGAVGNRLVELGADPSRMTTTYCTVDVSAHDDLPSIAEVRTSLGIPPNRRIVGHVGCLMDWKGQDVFLQALARVAESHPDVAGVVVGDTPDGRPTPYSLALHERALGGTLSNRVVMAGHRDDVPAVLSALDVFVHSSTKPEPFGTVIAEAMAAGVPVIAANDGGPPEYVREGETGLLTTPGDVDALATAIARLLDDGALTAGLVARGRAEVVSRFARERHVSETTAVYEQLLSHTSTR